MADNRTTSSWPLFPLRERFMSPSATSRIGKNARNMLKATACEIIPHCGMTLASALLLAVRLDQRIATWQGGLLGFHGFLDMTHSSDKSHTHWQISVE